MTIKAPRGTKDILPPQSANWQWIEQKIKQLFKLYNYQEIRTPIFEETELFVRGVGTTTDIVEKEMYSFIDKGGRSLTLRPEGTASVVRSYLEHKLYGQAQPFKFYYLGPMFRYERPQTGRYRQHHQTGVEVIGGDSPLIDSEVISLGVNILTELGLKNWQIHLNSIGCPQCRPSFLKQLSCYFARKQDQLCSDCQGRLQRNPLRILDCKNQSCQQIIKTAPKIIDHLCIECQEHFTTVQSLLTKLNYDFVIDPFLVRGLDYYTKTAFEVKAKGLGAQDTIFGGGRYDGLAEEIGGKPSAGMGFGMGLERLLLALEQENIVLSPPRELDVFICTAGSTPELDLAWKLLNSIRSQGLSCELDLLQRGLKAQLKQGDRKNARFLLIIGAAEMQQGFLILRDMQLHQQQKIRISDIIKELLRLQKGE